MRNSRFFYGCIGMLSLAFTLQGCKKDNGIDNNRVVKRPYSIFFGDTQGSLYNTSNGTDFEMVFPPDGYDSRAVLTSGNNLLFVKKLLHLSLNEGRNFNPVSELFINSELPWSPFIYRAEAHGRIYAATYTDVGVSFSEDNGATWHPDTSWSGSFDPSQVRMSSFAQLNNGLLFGYDAGQHTIFLKTEKDASWSIVSKKTAPPEVGSMYLSHFKNILLLTDYSGMNGVWYSTDTGQNWAQFNGLPQRRLLTTVAPLDQVLMVGTDSMGVYVLSAGNTFVSTNNGLDGGTAVRGIVGKDDVYKNEVVKGYIYITTNHGLFRSEDEGANWIRMFPGDFSAIY